MCLISIRALSRRVRQDQAEVHDPRLTTARVARLATTDPDGRPHLVPIVFALEGDTLYSAVDRKPKRSSKLRRIENARSLYCGRSTRSTAPSRPTDRCSQSTSPRCATGVLEAHKGR